MENKLMAMLVLLAVLNSAGCHSRFFGGKNDDPEDISGAWSGRLMLDGQLANINLVLTQEGSEIKQLSPSQAKPFFMINWSMYGYTYVTGSVDGHSFNLTGRDQSVCPNKWTFSGEVNGNTMVVTIDTEGNDVPGTDCYPKPIHERIAMSHR